MNTLDDKQLLADVAQGNHAALKALYQRYADIIYQFSLRTTGNAGDSAELVNEVLLAVWNKPDSYTGKASVKTWLLSIAHNKAVDAVRRNRRHRENHLNDEVLEHEAEQNEQCPLLNFAEHKNYRQFIQLCLQKLSDKHREVVHLTFFEEMSYPDIANILDVPVGTIKTRFMHAKASLKRCLFSESRGELADI